MRGQQDKRTVPLSAPQKYNGKDCYLFSNGEKNVYVEATAFYFLTENGKTFPSESTLSKTLTTYLNQGNSDYVCSTHVSCTASDVVFWEVSQVSSKAFAYSDAEMIVKSLIKSSVAFSADSNYNCLKAFRLNSSISYQPELTLKITNGGSTNAYFGGFKLQGVGAKTSKLNISSLLKLGYNASQIYSGTFTVDTFYDLISTSLDMTRNPEDSRFVYNGECESLSNTAPGKNIWTRQCSLEAPYEMTLPKDSYQMSVGIRQNNSTVKYAVAVKYNF